MYLISREDVEATIRLGEREEQAPGHFKSALVLKGRMIEVAWTREGEGGVDERIVVKTAYPSRQ